MVAESSVSIRLATRCLMGALMIPSIAMAQPTAGIFTDFVVQSINFADPAASNRAAVSPSLRASVANLLARKGEERFPYLVWKVVPPTDSGLARLVLKLEEAEGDCRPNKTTLSLIGVLQPELSIATVDLIENCDDDALTWPEATFQSKISTALDEFFRQEAVIKSIQGNVLSTIALTSTLEVEGEKLYLPIKPQVLRAERSSILKADYGDLGSLSMQPGSDPGVRTQMFIHEFRCGTVTSGGPLPETEGLPWHQNFTAFLADCRQPKKVSMREYTRLLNTDVATDMGGN